MSPTPSISVIIPTRNRAALLGDCLMSIINQTLSARTFEVVVVDDGSTDSTHSVVRDLRQRQDYPAISYLRSERRGLNVARNEGVKHASGSLLVFADDDLIVPVTWLDAFSDGAARHSQAACFGGPVRLLLEGKSPRLCARDVLNGLLDLGTAEREVVFVGGGNMAVRRAVLEAVGQFDERLSGYGDDAEWEQRIRIAGHRIVYLPSAWVLHRRTQNSLGVIHLLRSGFRRGRERVAYSRLVGEQLSLARETISCLRFIAHAIRRLCFGGLLSASGRAGTVWEMVTYSLRA